MKTLSAIASLVAALALTPQPATANLLVNGDFNTGDLTGWWTYLADANSSITAQPTSSFAYDSTPYAYQMVRDTSPDPLLGQDVTLTAGVQYQVSLNYRANNWGGAGVSIYYLDSSWAQIGYEWTQLYSGNGSDTGWQSFNSSTWTTPANTAHVEIRLDAWGWSDTYYDNVNLSVVPEPGLSALFALGGLLVIRRLRSPAGR
jgi:hypothetical protein